MSAQIEATLDGLRAKLAGRLPAQIDLVNADVTDDHTLDYPAEVTVGIRDSHDYPRIYVLPEDTRTEDEAAGAVIWVHRIRVVTFLAEWDEEALLRKLIRYQRAVREVVMAQRDPNPAGETAAGWRGALLHERDEYGPVFNPTPEGESDRSQFVQGAASLFVIRQGQTIS